MLLTIGCAPLRFFQYQRHRAVIDQLDGHVRAETGMFRGYILCLSMFGRGSTVIAEL